MPHRLKVIARGRRDGWRNERLLGKTFLDHQHEVVLQIGSDAYTREEVVTQLKCCNINACRNLTRAATELQVENVKQMAARVTLDMLFAVTGVGITTVYVWLCLLAATHVVEPLSWIDRPDDKIVTLSTEKLRLKRAQFLKAQQERDARRSARKQQHHIDTAAG